jgi:D-aminoacyl-tRNA deacylase
MKLLVVSKTNPASANIGKFLKETKGVKLETTQKNVLELDYLATKKPKPELLLVASTHRSEAGVPALTVHPTGNWNRADLGGKPQALSIAPALYLAEGLRLMRDARDALKLPYEVTLECTHHGPTFDIPVMFCEVGSGEEQWKDLEACELVANVMTVLSKEIPQKTNVAVGFGGPHYAPRFTKKVLEGEFAVGHICPGHHVDTLTEDLILEAITKTTPKPDFVALEWKGLKGYQRTKILEVLEKHKINWEKI